MMVIILNFHLVSSETNLSDSDLENVRILEPDDSANISNNNEDEKSMDESFENISMLEPDERLIPIR